MTATLEIASIHKFERAGLGTAPFRIIGSYQSKFQAVQGDPNCPIQAGSTCDYCGTAIMNVFTIRSSDGKEFKVGADCVAKAGDAGMVKLAKKMVNDATREARYVRESARIAQGRITLEEVRSKLVAVPHPYPDLSAKGKTMADWCDWMMLNAGNAGKLRVCNCVEDAKGRS